MYPSEIRAQILAKHRRLIALLDVAQAAGESAARGEGDEARLRAFMKTLQQELYELLDDEQELLHPALKGTDSFGEVRARQLEHRHRELRAMLARIRAEAEEGALPVRELALRLLQTVAATRADFRVQEQKFLHPDLLRDDLVSVAQSDG